MPIEARKELNNEDRKKKKLHPSAQLEPKISLRIMRTCLLTSIPDPASLAKGQYGRGKPSRDSEGGTDRWVSPAGSRALGPGRAVHHLEVGVAGRSGALGLEP